MNTAQPIKDMEELKRFKEFYLTREYEPRNQLLITVGLNTALRISDILQLRWEDVYDYRRHCCRTHIELTEQKTGKHSRILLNESIKKALHSYAANEIPADGRTYLFAGRYENLSRIQAWRIVKHAAEKSGISDGISPHSMRKTFGYMAWKNGVSPALLMDIFNHSSFEITQRYLGIRQDERDDVFRSICI